MMHYCVVCSYLFNYLSHMSWFSQEWQQAWRSHVLNHNCWPFFIIIRLAFFFIIWIDCFISNPKWEWTSPERRKGGQALKRNLAQGFSLLKWLFFFCFYFLGIDLFVISKFYFIVGEISCCSVTVLCENCRLSLMPSRIVLVENLLDL